LYKLFADDTKLYGLTNSITDCEAIQQDINILQRWSEMWLLEFNARKCKVMHIGKNQNDYKYKIHKDSGETTELNCTTLEKDLGINVDSHLKFKEHIRLVAAKANRTVGLIRRAFCYLDKNTFKDLFTALVRPQLEYGNVVWHPHNKQDIEALENVQRWATKMIPGLVNLNYPERLEAIGIPTITYRRWRGNLIEVFKFNNDLYDVSMETVGLIRDLDERTRGHCYQLKKNRSTT
jgi:hypothetical protein